MMKPSSFPISIKPLSAAIWISVLSISLVLWTGVLLHSYSNPIWLQKKETWAILWEAYLHDVRCYRIFILKKSCRHPYKKILKISCFIRCWNERRQSGENSFGLKSFLQLSGIWKLITISAGINWSTSETSTQVNRCLVYGRNWHGL